MEHYGICRSNIPWKIIGLTMCAIDVLIFFGSTIDNPTKFVGMRKTYADLCIKRIEWTSKPFQNVKTKAIHKAHELKAEIGTQNPKPTQQVKMLDLLLGP